MKLGVYCITETTGVIDEYVYYMLEQVRKSFDTIIVCTTKATAKTAVERLAKYAEHVVKYDDKNVKANSFLSVLGIETFRKFDSVTIWDDTLFGPVFPVEEMFETMEFQNFDFWGLFRNYTRYLPNGKIVKDQLFPHFVVLNKKVINSEALEKFIAYNFNSEEVIQELIFHLEYAGFQWDTYADTIAYRGGIPSENVDISVLYAYDLLRQQRCPFVNIEALRNTYFLPGGDETPYRTLQFIKNKTDYNVNYIWEHLLKTTNILDLKKALHLEYVLPTNCRISMENPLKNKKAAVIAHVYYKDLMDECFDFIQEIPDEIDVFIYSANEETRNIAKREIVGRKLKNCKVIAKDNRGRDFSALLIAAKDVIREYDYICFIHDKKSHGGSPITSGKTWMYEMWDCLLKSEDYIYNIIAAMEADSSLGLLVPPEPFHSEAIGGIGWTWAKNFDITVQLAKDLGVKAQFDADKHPIALGTAFWCKREALAALFDHDFAYTDFPDEPMAIDGTVCHALERIIGYVAQHEGYYTAYVMGSEMAALRGTKLSTYMTDAMNILRDENIWDRKDGGVIFDTNKHVRQYGDIKDLIQFCLKHPKLYIYGAGVYGKKCCETLQLLDVPVQAFVVTQKSDNQEAILGVPVISLEEFEEKKGNVGVIVALKRQFRDEVVPMLMSKGYRNITFFPN